MHDPGVPTVGPLRRRLAREADVSAFLINLATNVDAENGH